MEKLPDDTASLKTLVKALLEKVARLEAENAELRTRLGLNSTNSHKPPSSDGYAKKTTQPGIPKADGRKNGGQVGHRGKTLTRTAHPDVLEIHLPERCCHCARPIESNEACEIVDSRQVFDLPEPKLEVTEHRLGQITCCGVRQTGAYPLGVDASVQYGAGVRALVTLLSVSHSLSLERVSELCNDLFGYAINEQTLLSILARGFECAEPLVEYIKEQVLAAPVVHFDETGVRAAGKLHWAHTASTADYTYLFVHPKRGIEAIGACESILTNYRGVAVHDFWKPYFSFQDVRHALCGSHLLRELNQLIENGSQWAAAMHQQLLTLYSSSRPVVPIAQTDLKVRYQAILDQAHAEEPPPQANPRGRPKNSKGRNLYNRFKDFKDDILRFAFEPGVPFTNNQAERDLRGIKVKLKVSGGFRTLEGGQVYARLLSVIATCRKQNVSAFTQLRGMFLWQPEMMAWVG